MENNKFLRAEDVAELLSVSKAYAYTLVRQLNDELNAQGYITVSGRVSRKYFEKRFYGFGEEEGETNVSI